MRRRRNVLIMSGVVSGVCLVATLAWGLPLPAPTQLTGTGKAVAPASQPDHPLAGAAAGQARLARDPAPAAERARSSRAPASQASPSGASSTVTSFRYGPIPVPPAMGGVPGRASGGAPLGVPPFLAMPCTNCYITGTTIDLVYEDSSSANLDTGVMLHHLVLAQRGRPDATCAESTPIGRFGERFFAAGNERTSGQLPAGFGYHFGEGPLASIFDIMNHSDTPKTVYVAGTISYLPDSTPGIKAVRPLWLDMNNCSTSEYSVPAGASNSVWRWTSNVTGRVLTAAGHVHDGGIKTVLSNESTGQHLCTSWASYGTKPQYMGTVDTMSVCSWDRLGTVRAGEVLALDTHYDMAEPRSDVMGIMLVYLYETDDLTGGTEPPASMSEPPASRGSPPSGGGGHHHGRASSAQTCIHFPLHLCLPG
jgi:hypothetical protein